VGKAEGKSPIGKPEHGGGENDCGLKEVECEGVDLFNLIQDVNNRQSVV
jgi:hypothetical protein